MKKTSCVEKIKAVAGKRCSISDEQALAVMESDTETLSRLIAVASELREKTFGRKVSLCSIINARCGACSEDCRFCAQSSRYTTAVQPYQMMGKEEILPNYDKAGEKGVSRVSIVTSGKTVSCRDMQPILDAVAARSHGPGWCASLGEITLDGFNRLKAAGVSRYHHNLETARSFFQNVCTTHTYDQRLETISRARKAGLEICSGGILGLGETALQRVELARALNDLQVDSIPLNFLVPVPGTPFENIQPMKPLDMIRCIAMFRLVNPEAELRICAGRVYLRDLQSWIFAAGANGMMIGDLLTTAGRSISADLEMLDDLEMDYA